MKFTNIHNNMAERLCAAPKYEVCKIVDKFGTK